MYIDTVLLSPVHFTTNQSDSCTPQHTVSHLSCRTTITRNSTFISLSTDNQISSVVKKHLSSSSYRRRGLCVRVLVCTVPAAGVQSASSHPAYGVAPHEHTKRICCVGLPVLSDVGSSPSHGLFPPFLHTHSGSLYIEICVPHLYRSHSFAFRIKQTTFIESNTTQVYFNSGNL